MIKVSELALHFGSVRHHSERLCAGLATEDYVVQASPEVSPPKWHLAHTSWFFEEFVLRAEERAFRWHDKNYRFLFNSYYETVGPFFERQKRGVLSRPTVEEVLHYRKVISERALALLEDPRFRDPDPANLHVLGVVELGLEHEMQHQELLLTDILHNFAANPIRPAAFPRDGENSLVPRLRTTELQWIHQPSGIREIGCDADGFCFDNEKPRHRVFLKSYEIASRPVTAGEYMEFIAARGYSRPELWLSEGWRWVRERGIAGPLYWQRERNGFSTMTLNGWMPVNENAPVCHLSYFEADAFARWRGVRLPTEAEWEAAAANRPGDGHQQGQVWEWTSSPYTPYPGFRPAEGSLGEYNAKFMCNQFVLRGGSCVTPSGHYRATYRNFFSPDSRWQFSGLRLARD